MRLLATTLCLTLLASASNIDTKIKRTTSAINSTKNQYSSIQSKLDSTAKEILDQAALIQKQQQRLQELETALGLKETVYKSNIIKLSDLFKMQEALKKTQDETEQKLAYNIAKMTSLNLIKDQQGSPNLESIMSDEVIKIILKQTKDDIKDLNTKYFQAAEQMNNLKQKSAKIKVEISTIDQKKKELQETKKANENELAKLKINKENYKVALEKILKQQDSLMQTLSNLNIIKVDEKRRAAENERRRQAMNEKSTKSASENSASINSNLPAAKGSNTPADKVKKVGSSYQSVETVRYSGEKTIAPLEGYRVTKRYGNYTDPIYNIKIFNESVSLAPSQKGEKVRNVFNGKVIFAKNTPLLDNVVIVEHDNGLHTIYANLSQIAPGVQKGSKIIKGAVLGRVNDELVFEVTQRDSHIDPLELF
jgi:murein DD-endopeptidase MepM/ murein hydrolase activator NlpD